MKKIPQTLKKCLSLAFIAIIITISSSILEQMSYHKKKIIGFMDESLKVTQLENGKVKSIIHSCLDLQLIFQPFTALLRQGEEELIFI